jgi:NAD+ kinase
MALNMVDGSETHSNLVIVAKPSSGSVSHVLARVIPEFIGRGWTIYGDASMEDDWNAANLPPDILNKSRPNIATLGLVLGGDGTMLRAAREVGFSGTPLLGINLGFLGFLTAHPADRAIEAVQKYFAGQLTQDKRCTLNVSIWRGGEELASYEVMNDAVITKGALSRILNLELSIDDVPAAYLRADGLIVATPTGSTAYALSAGGPILHPTLKAWVLAPICPHSLNMRPSVIPAHMTIKVVISHAEEAHLTLDGQTGHPIELGDSIQMSDTNGHVTLLQDSQAQFFELLRQKMHWNRE